MFKRHQLGDSRSRNLNIFDSWYNIAHLDHIIVVPPKAIVHIVVVVVFFAMNVMIFVICYYCCCCLANNENTPAYLVRLSFCFFFAVNDIIISSAIARERRSHNTDPNRSEQTNLPLFFVLIRIFRVFSLHFLSVICVNENVIIVFERCCFFPRFVTVERSMLDNVFELNG